MKKWIWIENLIQLFGSKLDGIGSLKIQYMTTPTSGLRFLFGLALHLKRSCIALLL